MLMEKGLSDAGAIASAAAADQMEPNLQELIEDDRENYTRFFLLKKAKITRSAKPISMKLPLGKKSLQFFARDAQQNSVRGHYRGMPVRLPVQQRPLTQGVPGPRTSSTR